MKALSFENTDSQESGSQLSKDQARMIGQIENNIYQEFHISISVYTTLSETIFKQYFLAFLQNFQISCQSS